MEDNMSCEHCSHCQDQNRREADAGMLFELGTRLIVTGLPDLGVVTYWRGGTEMLGRDGKPSCHVVYCENTEDCKRPGEYARPGDDCSGHWISTESLVLAPAPKRAKRARKN
jgi:hypothetical protein